MLVYNKTSRLHWKRQWQPTPVLLPGESHGWGSLVGCSPWGRYESDTTEWLHFHFSLSHIGEGNGNPLQCSCLENPRDGGAWWAAVYGVAVGHNWSDLAAARLHFGLLLFTPKGWAKVRMEGLALQWGYWEDTTFRGLRISKEASLQCTNQVCIYDLHAAPLGGAWAAGFRVTSWWNLENTSSISSCLPELVANISSFLWEGLGGLSSLCTSQVRSKGLSLCLWNSTAKAETGFVVSFQKNDNSFPCVNFPTTISGAGNCVNT